VGLRIVVMRGVSSGTLLPPRKILEMSRTIPAPPYPSSDIARNRAGFSRAVSEVARHLPDAIVFPESPFSTRADDT